MLCNSLIQKQFELACCAWYPNVVTSKNKLQITQNAFIRICFGIERRSHIGLNTFEKINWLPVKNRVDQCMAVKTYTFKNSLSPVYMSNIYTLNRSPVLKARRTVNSFVEPIYMTEISRKSISYFRSKICNDLEKSIKTPPLRTTSNTP